MHYLLLEASTKKPTDTTIVREDNDAFIVRGKYHPLHKYATYLKRRSYLVDMKRGLRAGTKNNWYLHVSI